MATRANTSIILTAITGISIGFISIVLPLVYFLVSYQYLAGSLSTEAEINAAIIAHTITVDPAAYESMIGQEKLNESISQRLKEGRGEIRRYLDENNNIVAESADLILPPFITRSSRVMGGEGLAGRVEISRSLRPLLLRTAVASIVCVSFGGMIFYVLHALPLGTIRRAEQALTESEERYRDLFENANDLIQSISTDGSIVYVNAAWHNTLGYGPDEISRLSFIDVVHPDERVHCSDIFRRVLEGEKPESLETKFIAKGGRTLILEGSVSCYHKDGRPSAIRGIFHDITARKEAETSLNRTIEKLTDVKSELEVANLRIQADRDNLRSALDVFSEIISEVEKKKGFETYEYDPVENPAIPTCWQTKSCDYTSCPVHGRERQRCWQVAGTHCGGTIQGKFAKKFSDCRDCEVYREAIGNPVYEIRETFNNMMHILEMKQRELVAARMAAEDADRLKSEFLTNMSHEIRTPMNGIMGMTGLALETELTEEQRDYLKAIHQSSHALLNVINNILDFSKIEADRLELETSDFDLLSVVEGVADTLSALAWEKGLELACFVDPDIAATLKGDPGRLRQILLNLAGNAIKFTENGEVLVRADLTSETADAAEILFTVTDTGIGIPDEKHKAIFDPFVQIDGSTTRLHGGTGLGLTISRRLVNMMGGEMSVKSETGSGSRFIFSLRFEKGSGISMTREMMSMGLSSLRVLVVDDNETNRVIFRRMFEGFGCVVETAGSGREAVAILKDRASHNRPFRIVLFDTHMPGTDDKQTISEMGNLGAPEGLTVITMTSPSGSGWTSQRRGPEHEISLRKPVKQSSLAEAVSTIMKTRDIIETGTSGAGAACTSQATGQSDIRALLVEDNPINQKMTAAMLRKAGYEVDIADNGKVAVEAVRKKKYDVVLMDIQMPEMDGFEATRRIRAEEGDSHNIIIAVTAHAFADDRRRCIDAGMDDYISKPVNPREIFGVISRLMEQKWGQSGPTVTTVQEENKCSISAPVDLKNALERFDGDMDYFIEMLGQFLNYLPDRISELSGATHDGDSERVRLNAHGIKGAVAMFSAERALSIIKGIELRAASGDLIDIPSLIEDFKDEMRRLKEFSSSLIEQS